eukprot:TRINITY_DN6832_c0_g1_i1.p1 TRINITY_DN6832_c0_g1~~TRINITY_DN6832_c0_g1_i1.p1  ORF type:complete len:405 (+),score=119.30 TRINITY_DN6832_c0_g1_i1:40-1215(+)
MKKADDSTQRNIDRLSNEINQLEELKKSRENVTLIAAPVLTLTTFLQVLKDYLFQSIVYVSNRKWLLYGGSTLILLLSLLYVTPGSHQSQIRTTEEIMGRAIWWIGLGVLSSIGLGTGLHTFVLYLGPFIAKVTLAATECHSTRIATYGATSFVCPTDTTEQEDVSYLAILRLVQVEALLWGAGTALGELPPYFVARAARLSGMRLEKPAEEEEGTGFMARMKRQLPSLVKHMGFFGILLFASIPNPLFDLAGITCGHCLVPFWSFFGATLIGKAVIKAHLQTIFVITVFHKEHLAYVVQKIESLLPFLHGQINAIFEKERARLHRDSSDNSPSTTQPKTWLQVAWDAVLILMLSYFILSIVNASVQERLLKNDDDKLTLLRKQKKKLESQ